MLTGEIRIIGAAQGGISAQVSIVEIGNTKYVLKTDTTFNILGEQSFQRELELLGLPHIRCYEHSEVKPNQMLMEYIDAERLIGAKFTNDNLEELGKTLAKIHTRNYEKFLALDTQGTLHHASWGVFTNSLAAKAKKTNFVAPNLIGLIEKAAEKIRTKKQSFYSLCHGDVHGNNIFCTAGGLLLFDNNADAFIATPEYDLAILFGEVMPGYRYGQDLAQRAEDTERMQSFLSGYGTLPDGFEDYIDDYVLIRQLGRYPNPFVRHQDDILHLLFKKLS